MLTKATVVGVSITSPNKYIIRIPILNGSGDNPIDTPKNELAEATVCCLPGVSNPVSIGDIVYIDFEDNNLARPVILGHLYLGNNGSMSDIPKTSIGLNLSSLSVENRDTSTPGSATLPVGTSIGDITYKDLEDIKKFYQQWPDDYDFSKSPWYAFNTNGGGNSQ